MTNYRKDELNDIHSAMIDLEKRLQILQNAELGDMGIVSDGSEDYDTMDDNIELLGYAMSDLVSSTEMINKILVR